MYIYIYIHGARAAEGVEQGLYLALPPMGGGDSIYLYLYVYVYICICIYMCMYVSSVHAFSRAVYAANTYRSRLQVTARPSYNAPTLACARLSNSPGI